MTGIIKNNFRVEKAKAFVDSLLRTTPAAEKVYLFFGKDTAWTDEEAPDAPDDSLATEITLRNSIIGMKNVPSTNVAFVIPRIDWTTGTVYDEYSTSEDELYESEFYVLTEDYNVYKCIDNNGGAASIVKPTGTGISTVTTGDGYI